MEEFEPKFAITDDEIGIRLCEHVSNLMSKYVSGIRENIKYIEDDLECYDDMLEAIQHNAIPDVQTLKYLLDIFRRVCESSSTIRSVTDSIHGMITVLVMYDKYSYRKKPSSDPSAN